MGWRGKGGNHIYLIIGSFRNDDGHGSENVKKTTVGLLYVITVFCTFL